MPSSDAATLSRREFVRSLGVAGAALAAAPWLTAGAGAPPPQRRSLVLIHLAGGHDGLSTFVPCDDDAYGRARPTLALRRRDVLTLGESVWLNRAAAELEPLFERGELAVIPQVGLSPSSPSHHRASQVWWSGSVPEEVVLSRWTQRCQRPCRDHPGDFEAALAAIAGHVEGAAPGAIHHVRLEGFDTHFDQRASHDRVIAAFARGVAQFQRQLSRAGAAEQVLTVAFSEFGRALEENEFGGTHHGAAGQCYFIGAGVRGGVHGRIDAGTVEANVSHRRVIATVVEQWLGVDTASVLGAAEASLPTVLV